MINKDKGKKKTYRQSKRGGKFRSASGSTPGKDNLKRQGNADSRNKVRGNGGGVKRKKSPTLKAATKKQIKTAKKMNQAKGRKYKRK